MKNLIVLLLVCCCVSVFGTTYYSDSGQTNPSDLNNWWTNTDNSGSHPTSFTGSHTFVIQSGHNYVTVGDWIVYTIQVDGTLSIGAHTVDVLKNILGTGNITFTAAGHLKVADDFLNTGVFTQYTGCTVSYTSGNSTNVMKAATYYHLVIEEENNTKKAKFPSDNTAINVLGNCSIINGTVEVGNGNVLNITGTTQLIGVLDMVNTTGIVNMDGVLFLNGGRLGATTSGTINCSGITVEHGKGKISRCNLNVSGTTIVKDTVDFINTTGNKNFTGDVRIEPEGVWENSANESVTFGADLIVNGTFNTFAAKYTFTGDENSLGGSLKKLILEQAVFDGNYTNNLDTLTIKDDVSGKGSLTNPANAVLEIGDDANGLALLVASAAPNTVIYNNTTSAQGLIRGTVYYNLIVNTNSEAISDTNLNVLGNCTIEKGTFKLGVGDTLNVSGTTQVSGRLNFGDKTGVVNLSGPLLLSGGQLGSYYVGTINCTDLSVDEGKGKISRTNLNVSGITTIKDTIDFVSTSGNKIFTGDVRIEPDGVWENSANESVTFGSDLIVDGSFDTPGANYTFKGTDKSIGGSTSSLRLEDAIFNGTYTNHLDTLTITVDLKGSGSLTNSANSVLEIGGDADDIGDLVATAVPNTVIYNAKGNENEQEMKSTDYYNLIIDNIGKRVVVQNSMVVANQLHIIAGICYVGSRSKELVGKDLILDEGAVLELKTAGGITIPQFTGNYNLHVNSTVRFSNINYSQRINSVPKYGNLEIVGGNSNYLTGDLDVEGNLIISGGRLRNTSSNYTIHVAGDWINNSTFLCEEGVVVFDGTEPQYISGTQATTFYDCDIHNNSDVILVGMATVQNSLTATKGSLVIASNSTTSGSLILQGESTDEITYKRHVQGGLWHLLSAPVVGQDFWELTENTSNEIYVSGTQRAWTDYNEAQDDWTAHPSSDPGKNLISGRGYSGMRSTEGSISFTGTVNTENVSGIALTRASEGWNLLGNPYPSAIKATTGSEGYSCLLNTSNVDNLDPNYAALYLWDAATSAYKTISNAGGGELGEDYMQAGQGFFVRSRMGGGSFDITEAMQAHQPEVTLKSGNLNSVSGDWSTLYLKARTTNNAAVTRFAFHPQMTNGLDVSYDAGIFKANAGLELYSRLVEDNGFDFSVQCLPDNDIENLLIPIGVDVSEPANCDFSIERKNFSSYSVYLFDSKENTTTNLAETSYSTLVSKSGTGRFWLKFSSGAHTNVEDITKENELRVYLSGHRLNVTNHKQERGTITVMNMLGQEMVRVPLNGESYQTENLFLPAAYYVIRIQTETSAVSSKLFIRGQ